MKKALPLFDKNNNLIPAEPAKFLKGSILKHVINMSLSSSVGIVAIFLVDLADMYFLSLLGEIELASAIGYAGSVLFFTTSVSIGLAISMGSLVSKSLGEGNKQKANEYFINISLLILMVLSLLAVVVWMLIPSLIELLGATGRSAELSIAYLKIMIPSMPILGLAMASGAALRAVGDAKRSMFSTLAGGAVNAILDPIFIFTLNLGVEGAAYASVIARITILLYCISPLWKRHRFFTKFYWSSLVADIKPIITIAIPAILTNVATPFANGYVTATIANFGDSAVAGLSIISRLIPVAFGVVYAISGAIGPIIGQNYGARDYKRIQNTLTSSYLFVTLYVLVVSVLLIFSVDQIITIFQMDSEAAKLIYIFCFYVSFTFIFSGSTFAANAAFNNLGRPNLSTLINWGKATIGTIPFVYFGAIWFEASGVLMGQAIGNVIFGIISIVFSYQCLGACKKTQKALDR